MLSTPALLVQGSYLTFFHSSKWVWYKDRQFYFMGAYTFSAHPPFQILSITPEPIYSVTYESNPRSRKDWVAFVFPISFSVEGDIISLQYGRADTDVWEMELNKTTFLRSFVSVRTAIIGDSDWSLLYPNSKDASSKVLVNRGSFRYANGTVNNTVAFLRSGSKSSSPPHLIPYTA
jgi:hypothetical protein